MSSGLILRNLRIGRRRVHTDTILVRDLSSFAILVMSFDSSCIMVSVITLKYSKLMPPMCFFLHFRAAALIRFSNMRFFPHLLNILLHELPCDTRVRDLSSEARLRNLFHKSQACDGGLPIANVLCLDFNECHTWVFWFTIVNTVS